MEQFSKIKNIAFLILVISLSSFFGFLAGLGSSYIFNEIAGRIREGDELLKPKVFIPSVSQEQAVINVVNKASRAVVSVIVTKDLPVFESYYIDPFQEFEEFFGPSPFEFRIPQYEQRGTEKREIGGGTGFIVSKEGLILTNAHVVADKEADYTVLTNDGKRYEAKVLARDAFRDLAILEIESQVTLPVLELGDSDKLQVGQTVIAIGNALGEFKNTVSVGVVSGLGRQITAGNNGSFVTAEDVIQTDAAINRGNSGGPLLNLQGEVVGVNFAMAEFAQNIGFAVPISLAKKLIEQVKTLGKIVYPFLGVRYVLIDGNVRRENDLPVDYGAWIVKGEEGEPAVASGSAAQKAGLQEGDIILELDNEKITLENSLAKLIMKYDPGDKITLKVLRNGKEFMTEVVLGEREE